MYHGGLEMQQFPRLFSPIKVGSMELKNRFVVPPMATNLAREDGTVSDALIDYWVARARGGWGLLIVEFTAIDPLGKVGPCHPRPGGEDRNPAGPHRPPDFRGDHRHSRGSTGLGLADSLSRRQGNASRVVHGRGVSAYRKVW
jgi:hypothetical protein